MTAALERTPVPWLARALWNEFFRFRFAYPIDLSLRAAQKGQLDYYLYSDQLFLNDQAFDGIGVPLKRYRKLGLHYNPVFVAWWGLFNLQRHVRTNDPMSLRRFEQQIEWLRTAARRRDDGAVVWPCYFDWQEGRCCLKAPWISAMYQGVVISALVRAYRLTGNDELLTLSRRATLVFRKSIEDRGVRTLEHGHALYEEYPNYPLPRVLDGFLFSLLGLYDLYIETEDPSIHELFVDGIRGLRQTLGFWNYRNKWSWYGSHGYLCPPHYHALNRQLLLVLSHLAEDPWLRRQAELWDPRRLSWMDRLEVYGVFLVTKNWARVLLPGQRVA